MQSMQFSWIGVASNCLDRFEFEAKFASSRQLIQCLSMSSNSGLLTRLPPVRARIGASHFKSFLLGSGHVPGTHQARQVMDSMESLLGPDCLDARTWRSWFSSKPPRPRTDAVEDLDRCAFAIKSSAQQGAQRSNFYKEMMTGGLVRKLLEPTKSQTPESVMSLRAATYSPLSHWHLHLDALDVATLAEGKEARECMALLQIAISHLAEVLHEQWNVTSGRAYTTLSSDFALCWAEKSEQERTECQRALSGFRPPVFDWFMNRPPRPMFDSDLHTPEFTSRHVHKTLVCLIEDVGFLRADRLEAWTLALASSTLLLRAQIRVDQRTLVPSYPSDYLYVSLLERVLFQIEDDDEETLELLEEVQRRESYSWLPFSIDKLFEARSVYEHQLLLHGLPVRSVETIISSRN